LDKPVVRYAAQAENHVLRCDRAAKSRGAAGMRASNRVAAQRRKPTAIDIFCGCGGTTQGLRDAGFRVLAGVELDKLAVNTYRANHRRVKVWHKDVSELTPDELLDHHGLKRGQLDLLIGCPPCQAFSPMRRLNGRKRIRDKAAKDLVFEYLKFVEGLLPKVVLLENVPRLTEDYRFNQVRQRLRELGYVGQPEIFNAAEYGVPQRRRRMVFIASRVGAIGYAVGDAAKKKTVRQTIGKLAEPGKGRDALHNLPETRSPKVAKLIARIPKDGGSRFALGEGEQLRCHKKCDGFKDVYGRMAWDAPSPTITGGCANPSKGRFLHPEQNRAITLREAALLQTFPPKYRFSLDRGKFAAAQMIGNAFPPLFVQPHAEQICKHLRKRHRRPSGRQPRSSTGKGL
jgi:DNA (cytosine-5)-methyltransferase 1